MHVSAHKAAQFKVKTQAKLRYQLPTCGRTAYAAEKAIVEGGLYFLGISAQYADLEVHSTSEEERKHANLMLDLLIPIAKSFPAERGFESNALALQIHGGYGYTNEYKLKLAWEQNSTVSRRNHRIHSPFCRGKVMMKGGVAMRPSTKRSLETSKPLWLMAFLKIGVMHCFKPSPHRTTLFTLTKRSTRRR